MCDVYVCMYIHAPYVYTQAYMYACSRCIVCTRAIYPRRFVHSFAHIHKREAFVEPCKSSARCTNTDKVRSRAQHLSLSLSPLPIHLALCIWLFVSCPLANAPT